jgi:hypothetical protein
VFGYLVCMFEAPYYLITKQMEITDSEFQDYGIIWNGQWLTVVSMSTVGFGDFYPVTALGRITIIVAIFFGAWIFALLQDLKI